MFNDGGILYRQVNQVYAENYDRLMESGLYRKLVKSGLLISHQEVEQVKGRNETAHKVLQPERIPFISYPYEWSFSQYKEAALTTLSIQKRALKVGMTLKDASAYNIQFVDGKPLLIDTLSFETYIDGQPWVAYRQFCQHFLAPLALMAFKDVRLSHLMRVYVDGIPLDLASQILPGKTRLNFGLLTHIHVHAGAQKHYADTDVEHHRARGNMSKQAMVGLIESLEGTIKKLKWKVIETEWGNYYDITNYSDAAFEHKKEIIADWVEHVQPGMVWDLGANNGQFSRIASERGIFTVSSDLDPVAVEQNYLQLIEHDEKYLLPLLLDLTNPSPDLGWANQERDSFLHRGPADLVFALALIHHLAISNNVPLERVSEFFAALGKWLVVEFIPKSDLQVQKLLKSREDIFGQYTQGGFEKAFALYFDLIETIPVRDSERVLYLLQKRE